MPGSNGWKTINLAPGADIKEDILNTDKYCKDNSVDAFLMSHTYEHIPLVQLEIFVNKLRAKLKQNGVLIIIQTDIKKTLELYRRGKIDFYCLRDVIFSSTAKRKEIYKITGRDLFHHQFMWGAQELKSELLSYGFSKVEIFDAGTWKFDVPSDFNFQNNERYFNQTIPNLGILAYK